MHHSPVDVSNRVNELVTVEMRVRRTKHCSGSSRVFLDSEASHHHPNNLGVVITQTAAAQLRAAGIEDAATHFDGKTVLVRGVVIRKEDRPYIEVQDTGQVELLRVSFSGRERHA